MKTLDLGSGPNPKNPYSANEIFGADVRSLNTNVREVNLFIDPIPFPDNEFDFVTAFDFIEHVPRVLSIYNKKSDKNIVINPFINLMNEIYRVLKDGGIFLSKTPAFPHSEAFQDPTHVNIITENTFPLYFNDVYPVAHIYGFNGGFKVKNQYWDSFHLVTELIKSSKPDINKFNSY
jgi:SAM-dependent methyltransferase